MTRRSYCSTSFLPVELKTPSFKTLDYRGAAGGATGTGGEYGSRRPVLQSLRNRPLSSISESA